MIMKDNNKNRKLKFIRLKNNLRLGITKFYCSEKVSNIIKEDKVYWESLVETAKNYLYKTYKLKLPTMTIMQNQLISDDFVNDIHTNCIVLSK